MALSFKFRLETAVNKSLQKKLEQLNDGVITQDDAEQIGRDMVTEMKDMISKGISPIKSVGRFAAYKDPNYGYPSTVRDEYPDKAKTPVNLKLSGNFMRALTSGVKKLGNGFGIEIGYNNPIEQDKEKSHREGNRGQAKRPTIPIEGEQFAQRIQNVLLKAVREKIKKL
jgi:hypothetical protein